jgi:hypothetical protein
LPVFVPGRFMGALASQTQKICRVSGMSRLSQRPIWGDRLTFVRYSPPILLIVDRDTSGLEAFARTVVARDALKAHLPPSPDAVPTWGLTYSAVTGRRL